MRRKWIWIVAAIVVFLGIGAVKSSQDKKAEEMRAAITEAVETAAPTNAPAPTKAPAPAEAAELVALEPAASVEPAADRSAPAEPTPAPEKDYVLNANTMKFHKPSCSSVKDIKEINRRDFTGTRDEVIAMGYQPCGKCNP